MTPFEALTAMFTNNLPHARRIADLHQLDEDGRCTTCHSDGPSSGRPFGCTLGAAARKALRGSKP